MQVVYKEVKRPMKIKGFENQPSKAYKCMKYKGWIESRDEDRELRIDWMKLTKLTRLKSFP